MLLEVLLHIQLAEEAGEFTLDDVVYRIASKLVRRHPHVFGDEHATRRGRHGPLDEDQG